MRFCIVVLLLLAIGACAKVQVGEFTPKRHAMHDMNRPDCEKTPEKCIDGYPW